MTRDEVKKDLKQLRKLNRMIANSLEIEDFYQERIDLLKSKNMHETKEYKILLVHRDKLKTIPQLQQELELEEKYIDYLNGLTELQRKVAIMWFIEGKTSSHINKTLYISDEYRKSIVSMVYGKVWKTINEELV